MTDNARLIAELRSALVPLRMAAQSDGAIGRSDYVWELYT